MLAEIVWNENTIAIVCVFAVPIVGVVATLWASVERRKSDNELKRSMVERGMSVDDIERVISAKVEKR